MNASVTTVRRGLFGMFAGGLLAFGSAAIVAPVSNAQPAAPDCSASNVAGTVSSVAATEGAYLAANPQTDQALSAIATQPQPEAQAAYGAFFAQNPQVEDQLKAIHQPVSALQNQCGVEVVPTPVAEAVSNSTEPGETPSAPEAPEVIAPQVG
ncbi:heme-binding protein [Mycobacterium sp. NAZ190054]|uniref:heme-binding protein n=1 Tax=Mycobacterium sp. NAZ190054 TaxID=1747766 RepID=UPI000792E4DC|nr:heme-binding protein [Mycobacterium sp. NAZ190054]KWX68823.1 hypothetical protein ASJ79_16170 [Mycobacterium sp. NAZ190054]